MLEKQLAGDSLVPVGEYVDLDTHFLAEHPLDRKAAAVDLRTHRLDDGAGRRVLGAGCRLMQA